MRQTKLVIISSWANITIRYNTILII